MKTNLNLQNIAIIYDENDTFSLQFASGIKSLSALEQEKKPTLHLGSYKDDIAGLTPTLELIFQKKPQALIFPSNDLKAIQEVTRFLKSKKEIITLFTNEGWQQKFRELEYEPIYYISSYHHNSQAKKSIQFKTYFENKVRRMPSSLAANAFDAMMMIYHAYSKVQSARSIELTRALSNLSGVESLNGTLNMSHNGFSKKSLPIVKFKNGKEEIVLDL